MSEKHVDPRDAKIAELEAKLAAAQKTPVTGKDKDGNRIKPPCPPEFLGRKAYTVGPRKAYHDNRIYEAGETIIVDDLEPARDWTPVDLDARSAAKHAAKVAPAPAGRSSDKHVG